MTSARSLDFLYLVLCNRGYVWTTEQPSKVIESGIFAGYRLSNRSYVETTE